MIIFCRQNFVVSNRYFLPNYQELLSNTHLLRQSYLFANLARSSVLNIINHQLRETTKQYIPSSSVTNSIWTVAEMRPMGSLDRCLIPISTIPICMLLRLDYLLAHFILAVVAPLVAETPLGFRWGRHFVIGSAMLIKGYRYYWSANAEVLVGLDRIWNNRSQNLSEWYSAWD